LILTSTVRWATGRSKTRPVWRGQKARTRRSGGSDGLLVSGSAFTRRRPHSKRSRLSRRRPRTAVRFASRSPSNGALLERIDMRNLFSAYRDRAKPPRFLLVADPSLRTDPARGPPLSHHLIFECLFKNLHGIVSTLPRVSQRPSQHDKRNSQAIELQSRSRFR
jgi:hypothetical protein